MITLDTQISSLFSKDSSLKDMFGKKGLRCPHCHGSAQDTIRKVAWNNGLDPEAFLAEIKKHTGK